MHGLRARGDMDFDDISRVVPWIELSHDLGLQLSAEQSAEPRAFKSHLPPNVKVVATAFDSGDPSKTVDVA